MKARLDTKTYQLDEDGVVDTQDRFWQALTVTENTHGGLSLVLDSSPIDDRLACYTTFAGVWKALDYRGREARLDDANVLAFLHSVALAVREARDGS